MASTAEIKQIDISLRGSGINDLPLVKLYSLFTNKFDCDILVFFSILKKEDF